MKFLKQETARKREIENGESREREREREQRENGIGTPLGLADNVLPLCMCYYYRWRSQVFTSAQMIGTPAMAGRLLLDTNKADD